MKKINKNKPENIPLVLTQEVNNCIVTMKFVEQSDPKMIEDIKGILSVAYNSRVENELKGITEPRT